WRTSYTQFAPRLGFAHRLNREGSFMVRAGAGLFYDLSFLSSVDLLNGSPYNSWRVISATSPAIQEGSMGSGSSLKLPYSLQWSAAVERRLADRTVISAVYAGSGGRSLLRREGTV